MTNGQGIPNHRSALDKAGQIPKRPPVIKVLVPRSPFPKYDTPLPPPPIDSELEVALPKPTVELPNQRSEQEPERYDAEVQASEASILPSDSVAPLRPRRLRLPRSWQFWAVIAVLITTGIGGVAIALLLKLPALPNCPSIFWPTASASLRLYCAEVAANKQTVGNLLEAIALVNSLPADHPLRATVNQHIEAWSADILTLAEATFNRGKLGEAIATVRRIPTNTSAHSVVTARIRHWRSIWAEGESVYKAAQTALKQQDLRKAFTLAVQLLDIENDYWKTVKYQELTDLISAYRQDGGKLDRAKDLANQGGLENLLAAIKAVEAIAADSPLHAEAQRLVSKFGRDMLDLAEAALDRQDADTALKIVSQIPASAKLQTAVQDFSNLAEARRQAWSGTVADLEAAIALAQKLESDRPLYGQAQDLINRWQLQIQDINHLETARQMAQSGVPDDLRAAIAEAELVPRGNPLRDDARDQIAEWTSQVETIEDQPILDHAKQLALSGDIASLQAAIDQAKQIGQGRTLYAEAHQHVREWTATIQRTQDQPTLDRAQQIAATGDLTAAIAAANQIQSGRALYSEAQSNIRNWRDRLQNQAQLQQAHQAANLDNPAALGTAIRLAQQIPSDSSFRAEADRMINTWSQAMLRLAQAQAEYDLQGAIATVQNIPPRTEVYATAQLLLQQWQQQLNQVTAPTSPLPNSLDQRL
jgi:hypothetical protein